MYGSLVSSNIGITTANGVIHFNHHTSMVYVTNLSKDTDAEIKLNGIYSIYLPHVPNGAAHPYYQIPGDYTTIEVLTANTTVAYYAVG